MSSELSELEILKHLRKTANEDISGDYFVDLNKASVEYLDKKINALKQWTTPSKGPYLPKVEVREYDSKEWVSAELLFIDKSDLEDQFIVRIYSSGEVTGVSQCRMEVGG